MAGSRGKLVRVFAVDRVHKNHPTLRLPTEALNGDRAQNKNGGGAGLVGGGKIWMEKFCCYDGSVAGYLELFHVGIVVSIDYFIVCSLLEVWLGSEGESLNGVWMNWWVSLN